MAKTDTNTSGQKKAKPRPEKSIAPTHVTVISKPASVSMYTMQRKMEEIEDRVATCELVMENDFSDHLGRLIDQRTRAMERSEQGRSNNTMEALLYIGIGVVLLISVLANLNSDTPRHRYVVN